MNRPANDVFGDLSRALFGENGATQNADALEVRYDSIRKWRKGKSRVPPGVWDNMIHLAAHRITELQALIVEAQDALQRSTLPREPHDEEARSQETGSEADMA